MTTTDDIIDLLGGPRATESFAEAQGRRAEFASGTEGHWTRSRFHGETTFGYSGKDPDWGHHFVPGVQVDLKHPKDRYFYNDDLVDPDSDLDTAVNTDALFEVDHTPPKIDLAVSSKGYHGHVPTVLGRAALHSLHRFGEMPVASSDLSVQSERLVRTAASKGLVQVPEDISRNTVDLRREDQDISVPPRNDRHARDAPQSDVASSQQFIRHALRKPQPEAPLDHPRMF
jgi:hypothetical protein